jgi:hypothetical protein
MKKSPVVTKMAAPSSRLCTLLYSLVKRAFLFDKLHEQAVQ